MGDAAGIGPELCLRLFHRAVGENLSYHPAVVGDVSVLRKVSETAAIPFDTAVHTVSPDGSSPVVAAPVVVDLGLLNSAEVKPGRVQVACGRAAGVFIRHAVEGTQRGIYDAIVTAPINKEALNLGGFDYPGHTEMLADLVGCLGQEAMLFHSPKTAVILATVHTSLNDACRVLTTEKILHVTRLAHETITKLRGRPARLGILGLNPHAGESGLFGSEEERIIRPAIEILREEGIEAEGPLVPDAVFVPRKVADYDCFVAMYHDQGTIPFKMLAFDEGVNVTVGLPLIRTSPDHGTAFDIAWKGEASASSFFAAADLAARLVCLSEKTERERQLEEK